MELKQLKNMNEALDILEQEYSHYSDNIKHRLEFLPAREIEKLTDDALISTKKLAKEVLAQNPSGELDLGELGKYLLGIDETRDRVSLYRDRDFDYEGMHEAFATVFHVNLSKDNFHRTSDVLEVLDAQETMSAIHSVIFPQTVLPITQ